MLTPRSVFICGFILLCAYTSTFSQASLKDLDYWTRELSKKGMPIDSGYLKLEDYLNNLGDTSATLGFFEQMQKKNRFAGPYINARLKASGVFFNIKYNNYQSKNELILQSEQALNTAYETGDEQFIAFISFACGTNAIGYQDLELAATYLLKGQEYYDRTESVSNKRYFENILLGEVLFHCMDYEKSIYYTRKVIDYPPHDSIANRNFSLGKGYNTIGQNYERLNKWDSALAYYEKSNAMAGQQKSNIWKGINAGFIGGIYLKKKDYKRAKPLLLYCYDVTKNSELQHAAKSLQQLAEIYLTENKNDSALLSVREAKATLDKLVYGYYLQPETFLEKIYFTTADTYRAMGKRDSFNLYNQLYNNLHDSVQKVYLLSSTKIAKMRVDNENNFRAIQLLQEEKDNANFKRNVIIMSVVLASILLLLYLNRVRLKHKQRHEFAIKEKNAAEAELNAAKEQMKMITENVVEKTALVEKLTAQLSHRERNTEQEQLITEISRQTILTEEEWENFKQLFEKIHPGFFIRLRERSRDITIAEQRMAALSRLNLTARQMASMLGISVDSVHKTRQRLRQRLQFSAETNLEETLSSI
jgi:DNA-binding CsgD family transcriptional regulator